VGHAEVALQVLLGVAAALVADDHHGLAVQPRPAADDGGILAEGAIAVQQTLCKQLDELRRLKPDKLVRRRREKFMRMGQFLE
jgi:hypothetical protein